MCQYLILWDPNNPLMFNPSNSIVNPTAKTIGIKTDTIKIISLESTEGLMWRNV